MCQISVWQQLKWTYLRKPKYLIELIASHNEIAEIPTLLFHKVQRLSEVDFSFNKIQKVKTFAFSGDFNLRVLDLSYNQLTTLPKRVFKDHSRLKFLNLSANQFEKIDAEWFENLGDLRMLNLSRNHLTEIRPGTFSRQQDLQILDLSNNYLKKLDANILPPLTERLNRIDIANNQLSELSGFATYKILDTKIYGIDSNKFNCTYLMDLLKIFTWKHLDSAWKIAECISIKENEEQIDSSEDAELSTTKTTETNEVEQHFIEMGIKVLEEERRPIASNEGDDAKIQHTSTCKGSNYSHSVKFTDWIMSICLVIIAVGMIWFIFRVKLLKSNLFSVSYHQNNVAQN